MPWGRPNPGSAKQLYDVACTRDAMAEACAKVGRKPKPQATAEPTDPKPTPGGKPSRANSPPRGASRHGVDTRTETG